MIDVLLSAAPLLFLIIAMGHPRGLPGFIALPLAGLLAFAVVRWGFAYSWSLTGVGAIAGILSAFTPISIVLGAMYLFAVLQKTHALDTIASWVRNLSGHPVAQLMLIGWAFPFLIEGISGFGTPAALAAPLLVGLGFPPLRAALMTLIANTVPVCFGAVGTPIWFGLGELELASGTLRELGAGIGLLQLVCGSLIPFIAILQVLPWQQVRSNWKFILLSSWSCTAPMALISLFSAEFPALLGGGLGLIFTAFFARRGWGLQQTESTTKTTASPVSLGSLVRASFPIWGSVCLLLVTRLPQLGLKELLQSEAAWLQASIPWLGSLRVSPALVFQLDMVAGGDAVVAQWKHPLLYIPSIVPFVLTASLYAFAAFPQSAVSYMKSSMRETLEKMARPALALFGALVLVKLLILQQGQELSAIQRLGDFLSRSTGEAWPWFAFYLGALGSFFSGSATVSNLTFGSLQNAIGLDLGVQMPVLILQAVGAATGNMVCLHNIVAVCAILSLENVENQILRRTALILLVFGIFVTTVALLLF